MDIEKIKQLEKTFRPYIIVGFIAAALLTIFVPKDENKDRKDIACKTDWDANRPQVETVEIDGEKYVKIDDESKVTESNDKQTEEEKKEDVTVNKELETDPYEELESLIGMESVKEEVRSLANIVKIQKEREAKGLKNAKMSYHLVFTGSPGTGKTTVARIMARIYKDLGVLKKGHLVETDRSGLVAEYVGQTAVKTNAVIDSAMNGVLFIDEAYALTEAGQGDYGSEAISTLLKRMEDDRDRLVVIVAGYSNEMKRFIESNPGLQSRFNRYLNFPDYSADDLYNIYMLSVKKYKYILSVEASKTLKDVLNKAVARKDKHFGNARYARNLFENTLTAQANRLAKSNVKNPTVDDLSIITAEDILNAVKAK